jgi:hypothetical protein
LTLAPSWKCISLRHARTRARMETSWRARVVPMGSAMIGTVIRRASTTETTRDGGTRSGSTRDEQPAIVTEAQATPRAGHGRVLGLISLRGNMIAFLHKRVGADRAVRRLSSSRHVQDTPEIGRCSSEARLVSKRQCGPSRFLLADVLGDPNSITSRPFGSLDAPWIRQIRRPRTWMLDVRPRRVSGSVRRGGAVVLLLLASASHEPPVLASHSSMGSHKGPPPFHSLADVVGA